MTSKAAVRRGVVWIVVAVVVIGGAAFAMRGGGAAVQTEAATSGAMSAYVEERGETSLPDDARRVISMPVDGRVLAVGPDVGGAVTAGQGLVEIDTEPFELEIAQARAKAAGDENSIAMNAFDKLEKTALREANDLIRTMNAMVEASTKQVEATEVQLEYADWWRGRVEELFGQSAAGEQELQRAKTDFATAGVQLSYQNFVLAAVKVMDEVVNLYPQTVLDIVELKGMYRASIEQRLAGSRAQLRAAELTLSDATERVKSPLDGVVLARHVTDESVIAAGTPLIEVGDLSRLEITTDLLTQEAVDVSPGDRADVFGLSYGTESVQGSVTRVDPKAFTKLSSLGVEEQRVTVTIALEPDDLAGLGESGRSLGEGFRVRVRIHTAEADSAVRVPRAALFRGDDGGWRVFKIVNARAVLTPITVGLMNDREVQVLDGVGSADRVVLAPGAGLGDGDKVMLE